MSAKLLMKCFITHTCEVIEDGSTIHVILRHSRVSIFKIISMWFVDWFVFGWWNFTQCNTGVLELVTEELNAPNPQLSDVWLNAVNESGRIKLTKWNNMKNI